MEVTCPKCGAAIGPEGVNVARDVAYCASCQEAYALSELVGSGTETRVDETAIDIDNPPQGCWFEMRPTGFEVGSTARSGAAIFFLVFALFWNSIVSVFLSIAIAGLFKGEDVMPGPFPGFLFVFLIPFILVGLGTGSAALVGLFGKVVVAVDRDDATIFTGIRSIGWRRRFAWSGVRSVGEAIFATSDNGQTQRGIQLDGERRIRFASLVREDRRQYMIGVLKRAILPQR